jgi:hypothetical protein
MLTIWSAAALAGVLEVATPENAEVYVDRAMVPNARQVGRHVVRGLQPGMHEIEIRIGHRMVDNVWVEVPGDASVRVEWAPSEGGAVFSVFAPQPMRPGPRGPEQPPVVVAPVPAGPTPMEPRAFQTFRAQLEASSFDSGRLGLLETATVHNVFTMAQVAGLLTTFDFDSKRQAAACLLAPRVIDPGNAHEIGATFDFDSSRTEALACFR